MSTTYTVFATIINTPALEPINAEQQSRLHMWLNYFSEPDDFDVMYGILDGEYHPLSMLLDDLTNGCKLRVTGHDAGQLVLDSKGNMREVVIIQSIEFAEPHKLGNHDDDDTPF